jgi:hypothetical protein
MLVVIDQFQILNLAIIFKAKPPPLIDPDTKLPLSLSLESLETV